MEPQHHRHLNKDPLEVNHMCVEFECFLVEARKVPFFCGWEFGLWRRVGRGPRWVCGAW